MDATASSLPSKVPPFAHGAGGVDVSRRGSLHLDLRRMGLQDLDVVSNLHRAEFQDGFFVRMGPRFLRRYYRTFLDGPLATAMVCEREGQVCGYVVGLLDPGEHRRLLIRHHGPSLALHALMSMLVRPGLALHFVRTRSRRYLRSLRRHARVDQRSAVTAPTAVLSYVAVDPGQRGLGIGSVLVAEFVRESAAAGCGAVCLVTMAGTHGAGDFYVARGWRHLRDERRSDGRVLGHYQLQLEGEG